MENKNISDIKAYKKNPRKITDKMFTLLGETLEEFGDLSGIVVNVRTGEAIGGNQRTAFFKQHPEKSKVVITERFPKQTKQGTTAVGYVEYNGERFSYREVNWDNKTSDRANIVANKVGGFWDNDILANEFDIEDLKFAGFEDVELNFSDDNDMDSELSYGKYPDAVKGSIAGDYLVPPFSILDTMSARWQERRRDWLSFGIESENGRDADLIGESFGTSVFDPVLCELMYKWFNVPNGNVLDPFAGGSVRGVLASKCGCKYKGIELRKEQVEANKEQVKSICDSNVPEYINGDSNVELDNIKDNFDMIFSCPPYADLEVYSNDPADISNMEYDDFIKVYRSIIKKATDKLKDDRFAVFVVSEVRAKDGSYYNFVGDTIKAFNDCGLHYYNEIILKNAIGTLPLRMRKAFNYRKVGRMHQNILVFYKGNMKNIKKSYPQNLDFDDLTYTNG